MCETGIVSIDDLCTLGLRTAAIFYLCLLGVFLTVLAAWLMGRPKWRRVVRPYRNELRMSEFFLFRNYADRLPRRLREAMEREFQDYPEADVKLSAAELQGMWQAVAQGARGRSTEIAAILLALLLIAR